uniref:Uncharacterized protein n=1 Tax=Neogobius melanostomus TaxID=47308 RepID=A0A8C6U8Z5_9GOBI
LIYCMGDEADDILRGQALSDVQRQRYQAVRDTLDIYFVPRKNIIYERSAHYTMCSHYPFRTFPLQQTSFWNSLSPRTFSAENVSDSQWAARRGLSHG